MKMTFGSFGVPQGSGLHCSRCYIRRESPVKDHQLGIVRGLKPSLSCNYVLVGCELDYVLVRSRQPSEA